MKKILLFGMAALTLSLLAGCGGEEKELTAEEKRQEAALTSGAAQSGNLQEGAQVETSRDARGNVHFSYSNPDGSGAGGYTQLGNC